MIIEVCKIQDKEKGKSGQGAVSVEAALKKAEPEPNYEGQIGVNY